MWQRWNQSTHIFEKSDNDGASWVPLPLDVSAFSEGVLAKARQHAETAYKIGGDWTPVLTFATPGDLSVSYSDQTGKYKKIENAAGSIILATFRIITTAFTHTTAAGACRITGLPVADALGNRRGILTFQGITKATYTSFVCTTITGQTYLELRAGGSGVANAIVDVADMPTGGVIQLAGTIIYFV